MSCSHIILHATEMTCQCAQANLVNVTIIMNISKSLEITVIKFYGLPLD